MTQEQLRKGNEITAEINRLQGSIERSNAMLPAPPSREDDDRYDPRQDCYKAIRTLYEGMDVEELKKLQLHLVFVFAERIGTLKQELAKL